MNIISNNNTNSKKETPMAQNTAYRLMMANEVAVELHIPLATIYEYARKGLLPSIRIGRAVRFKREDIDAFIEAGGTREVDV